MAGEGIGLTLSLLHTLSHDSDGRESVGCGESLLEFFQDIFQHKLIRLETDEGYSARETLNGMVVKG